MRAFRSGVIYNIKNKEYRRNIDVNLFDLIIGDKDIGIHTLRPYTMTIPIYSYLPIHFRDLEMIYSCIKCSHEGIEIEVADIFEEVEENFTNQVAKWLTELAKSDEIMKVINDTVEDGTIEAASAELYWNENLVDGIDEVIDRVGYNKLIDNADEFEAEFIENLKLRKMQLEQELDEINSVL